MEFASVSYTQKGVFGFRNPQMSPLRSSEAGVLSPPGFRVRISLPEGWGAAARGLG